MDEKPSEEELFKKKLAELAKLTGETTDLSIRILGKRIAKLTIEAVKAFEAASEKLEDTAKRLRERLEL